MRLRVLVVSLSLASAATAQLGAPKVNPAFPGGSHRIDVQSTVATATGLPYDAFLGVARDLTGSYWVTARRAPRLPASNQHMLFKLDPAGNFVAGFPQPASTADSDWGLRDLAFDGLRYLFGGAEGDRIVAFDTFTGTWDPSQDWIVPVGMTFSTLRALAYDPTGDSGAGSLWAASFTSEHIEFTRTGTILRRVPNLQPGTYGAAHDPVRGSIWWFGQSGGLRRENHVVATEMSTTTGAATGHQLVGDLGVPGLDNGGFAGGAEFYTDANGDPVLLLTAQGYSDTIYEIFGRFWYGASSGGAASFDGGTCQVGNSSFGVTLENSAAQQAALLVGFAETDLPLDVLNPVFEFGTHWLIDTSRGEVWSPLWPVVGARARQALPLPNNPSAAGLRIWFQWIEISFTGPGTPAPIRTSTGGKIWVNA